MYLWKKNLNINGKAKCFVIVFCFTLDVVTCIVKLKRNTYLHTADVRLVEYCSTSNQQNFSYIQNVVWLANVFYCLEYDWTIIGDSHEYCHLLYCNVLPCSKWFALVVHCNVSIWAYLIKVIPETRRVQ